MIRNARFSRRKIVVTDAILIVSLNGGHPQVAWIGDAHNLPPPEMFAQLIANITLSAAHVFGMPHATMQRMVEMQAPPTIEAAFIDPVLAAQNKGVNNGT